MDREEAVYDALRALSYAEMIAFAAQLRDTAAAIGRHGDDAEDWASLLQSAMDAYDARDEA